MMGTIVVVMHVFDADIYLKGLNYSPRAGYLCQSTYLKEV